MGGGPKGFPKGRGSVTALNLIVDNNGGPTLLGNYGKWPHANFLTGSILFSPLLGMEVLQSKWCLNDVPPAI